MTIPCIVSIDQGTSSTRVLIISSTGAIVSQFQTEHKQYYPTAGQVEHDPLEIWNSVKICLSESFSSLPSGYHLVSIGITNQRETTVIWNKVTGLPYHNAIVWNDNRTGEICNKLINGHGKDRFRHKTGLPVASYFSATKIMHLLEAIPGLRASGEKGEAIFGTIDTWLIWKLTGGKVHATDVSNASRTLLMDLTTLQWDEDILRSLNIPRAMLPQIHASNHLFGHVDADYHAAQKADLPVETYRQIERYTDYHCLPINGVLGDQQAALFGQTCFQRGEAKCTYGTGAFLLMNTGHSIVHSTRGLLTTVAYKLVGEDQAVYALEGSVAYCGSLIQWLRDNLGVIASAKESETVALTVKDNGGVYFVPAFAGLYAPYWRQDARGIIAGLTAYNTKAHIVRAALEAAAFQTTEVVHAMHLDSAPHGLGSIRNMRVDGGVTSNRTLMQFQSDLLDAPLQAPVIAETTAMGAAFMAGLGAGVWKDLEELQGLWSEGAAYSPHMKSDDRARQMHHWKKALSRALGWVDHASFDADGNVTYNAHSDSAGSITDDSRSHDKTVADSFAGQLRTVPVDNQATKADLPLQPSISVTGLLSNGSGAFHGSAATDNATLARSAVALPSSGSEVLGGRFRAASLHSGSNGQRRLNGFLMFGAGLTFGVVVSHFYGSEGAKASVRSWFGQNN